jgi:hypothetical protein
LQKERVPVNIEVGDHNRERNSQMTDEAVDISITIRVSEREMKIEKK